MRRTALAVLALVTACASPAPPAPVPTAPSAEVRFARALALAYAGRGADAIQVLDSASAESRDPFVRGLALDATNQHAQAMQSLAQFADANALVAAAVWLEVAEREMSARRPREAADATVRALDTAQGRPLRQRVLEIRAQALAVLGDDESAFDAHRQVLTLATSSTTLGEQLFRLAQVSRDLGKPDAAVQALKTALDRFPSATTTADALRLLDELGAAGQIDPFILGQARYFAVDYRNAVTAFDQYLRADPNGPDVPTARLFRALANLTPGNEPNALRELDAIADDPDQDTEIAAQALLEAGQALEALSEPDQAEARYQKLLDKFPRLDAAATAGFRLGLVRYVRAAESDALAAWEAQLARRDDLAPEDVSRDLYWRAKALNRLGRAADAHASLVDAAALRPANYYTLRAATMLGQVSAGTNDEPRLTSVDEQQLGQWLAGRNQDLAAAWSAVSNDPALLRAQAEANLGLFREGNWEADELLQRYPDRTDRLYALGRGFADLGLVGGATRLGQAAYRAASIQTPQDAPAALQKIAFPRPFANLTDAAAARYGIDPLLLESTFRDASQFDAWAENVATGARGLALTSPLHAEEAARGRRVDPNDQFKPTAAVDEQAWLLADRLRRFDGRPEAALSALDTTDRLVDSWMVRRGADDPDAYLELLDFKGVRAGLHDLLATRVSYAIVYGRPDGNLTPIDPIAPAQVKPEPIAAWIKIARVTGDVPPDAPQSPPIPPGSGSGGARATLARATTLQRDGDYDGAAEGFRAAASSADPDLARAANLGLGEALLGAGRPAEALPTLESVESAQSGATPATFLTGRALANLGRCNDAIAHFERFAAAPAMTGSVLGAQAQAAAASCLQDLGRPADAVSLLQQATGVSDVARLQALDFREKLALARVRAGDVEGARADYAALLSNARSSSYRAELNYDLGVLVVETDPATAVSHFRASVQLDPKSRAAQVALDELVALRDPAAQSYEAGDTRFEQNRYREALAAYTTFVQQNPSDSRAARAYYGRGTSLVRLGQDRAGIIVLESIGDRFPNTSEAADGLFRGGRIRESLADLDGAAQAYRQVMEMSGAGSRATDAEFRLAFVQFRQGSLDAAVAGWRDLAGRLTAPNDRTQAFFWLGKGLRAAGDAAGASTAWTSARTVDARGFYGLRAAEQLAGQTDPRAQIDQTLPRVEAFADDPMPAMQAWAATRGDLAAAQQRLADDPGLGRAETLLAMGLRQPALWELGAVQSRLGNDAAAVALLGGWEQQRGLYNAALLLGFDLAGMANVSPVNGPAPVRRLMYPLPHPGVLAQAARQLQVDPLLFAGLMLQESLMDQSVESVAQARGLSQLIASTGYDAARALGQYNFRSSDLFKPKVSITLGAFTFSQRLTRFDQRIFPALAAYNAAQFAVDGWLLAAGEADIDTFAEAIPFTETYPYVQRIYENYKQYLELYGP
ncbi:MAG: transglycosylase SLT domain-containing protein [Chloroflexi bacterium]|nr:transglycosylase SLT domain-containing protein [Chloroflexota bacterium]